MNYKLSTEIDSISNIVGEQKAIEVVAKAGFDAWDFSMFKLASYDWPTGKVKVSTQFSGSNAVNLAKTLKKIGEDYGIHCNQSHAPFPSSIKQIRDSLKTAIELTAIAGGKTCIIHPDNNLSVEENTQFYLELLPFAKQHGVAIATENMWNWNNNLNQASICACSDKANFCAQMQALQDDYFVACLDIGHAEMKGLNTSAVELIYALGNRLKALHIHDNDKWHDSHEIPFSMNIDFVPIVKALKDIGYDGYLTLEADRFLKNNNYTADNVQQGVNKMCTAAKTLLQLFDAV